MIPQTSVAQLESIHACLAHWVKISDLKEDTRLHEPIMVSPGKETSRHLSLRRWTFGPSHASHSHTRVWARQHLFLTLAPCLGAGRGSFCLPALGFPLDI